MRKLKTVIASEAKQSRTTTAQLWHGLLRFARNDDSMIVGLDGTVVGTGDSGGGPEGTIENIPMPAVLGPAHLVRWYFADGMRSNRQMKMKKPSVQTLLQAAACLLCAIVAAEHSDLAYIEFGGGTLTGPLVDLNNIGGLLFIVALIPTFIYRRLAAICALAASLLCLPLYLYRMVPGIAQRLIPGSFRYLSRTNFVWNEWAFIGILLLAITAYICIRAFSAPRGKSINGV